MNRRDLLAASGASVLVGISGCIDELEAMEGNVSEDRETEDNGSDDDETETEVRYSKHEGDVPGCRQKEEWNTDSKTVSCDPKPSSIAGQRDCTAANRPEPTGDVCAVHEVKTSDDTRTYESAGVEPYPDPPSTVDEKTVVPFVHDYERARSRNQLVEKYGDRLLAGRAMIGEDETRVLVDDDIATVRIQFAVHWESISRDGFITTTEPAPAAAVYGVDETGIVRAEAEYADQIDENALEEMPDPVEDGDLLECF